MFRELFGAGNQFGRLDWPPAFDTATSQGAASTTSPIARDSSRASTSRRGWCRSIDDAFAAMRD